MNLPKLPRITKAERALDRELQAWKKANGFTGVDIADIVMGCDVPGTGSQLTAEQEAWLDSYHARWDYRPMEDDEEFAAAEAALVAEKQRQREARLARHTNQRGINYEGVSKENGKEQREDDKEWIRDRDTVLALLRTIPEGRRMYLKHAELTPATTFLLRAALARPTPVEHQSD